MTGIDPHDLVTSIVRLRRAIVATRDRGVRADLRAVEVLLRRALGPTITKTQAARALGISVTALDRWVDQGILPAVERPGSSRRELETRPVLDLAGEVVRGREEHGETRTPVAAAVRRLGWVPRAEGRRVLRADVAALPRPNVPEAELVDTFRSTTPEERVREVAELSRALAMTPGAHS